MTSSRAFGLMVLVAGLSGCGRADAPGPTAGLRWDTLPSGAVRAVYAALPPGPALPMAAAVRIGGGGAVGPAALGDVRGIDIDPGGAIMVLDFQASEVRAFDPQGAYLGTVAQEGEGPGEIVSANGIRFDSSGALWINDHGRRQLTRIGPNREFATYPMIPAGFAFGYLWEGGLTRDGRVWDVQRLTADPPGSPMLPEGRTPGPQDLESQLFFKSLDPTTGAQDSVALGTVVSHVAVYPRVTALVPFAPIPLSALDPSGAIWTAASSDAYRLVKRSLTGDTLLIVEIPGEGPAIPDAERSAEIARLEEFLAGVRSRGGTSGQGSDETDWDAVVRRQHPVLIALSVDDRGRLWVQRRTDAGPVFDVFMPTGELLATVDPDFEPWHFFPPVVRGAQMYALVTDSLDVPSVVRAPLPLR